MLHKHKEGNSEFLEASGKLDINFHKASDPNHSPLAVKYGHSEKLYCAEFQPCQWQTHFSLDSVRKLKSGYRKGNVGPENGKLLSWLSCYLGRFTGVSDRIPGHCWVSSLALPHAHHVGRTKFHIYWTAIMLMWFTVGLRVCNSAGHVCSYIDISRLLVHKYPKWKAAALCLEDRWVWSCFCWHSPIQCTAVRALLSALL